MRNRGQYGLPKLPRRRSPWQRAGLRAGNWAGLKLGQLIAGFAIAFGSIAVANTFTDNPAAPLLIALSVGVGAAVWIWSAGAARRKRSRRG